MAIPDHQSLMLPVLKIAAQGETRVPLAAEIVADQLDLSQEEKDELLPSGKQRLLHNRIHWAKFYMSKAGLIESPKKAVFRASSAGLELLKKGPAKIDVELLRCRCSPEPGRRDQKVGRRFLQRRVNSRLMFPRGEWSREQSKRKLSRRFERARQSSG